MLWPFSPENGLVFRGLTEGLGRGFRVLANAATAVWHPGAKACADRAYFMPVMLSRRQLLATTGQGFGALAFASLEAGETAHRSQAIAPKALAKPYVKER